MASLNLPTPNSYELSTASNLARNVLIFQGTNQKSSLHSFLENEGHTVQSVSSLSEWGYHSRNLQPEILFFYFESLQKDLLSLNYLKKAYPKALYFLWVSEKDYIQLKHEQVKAHFHQVVVDQPTALKALPYFFYTHFLNQKSSLDSHKHENDSEELEKNKLNFVQGLSNNFRQPLEQMVQFAHIALQRNQRQQFTQVGHYLAEMKLISEEMLIYIQELKEIAKLKAKESHFHLEELDLTEHLKKLKRQFAPIAQSRQVDFELINHVHQPYARGDRTKFTKVISVLLGHLLKKMNKGEKVLIIVHRIKQFFEIDLCVHGAFFKNETCQPLFDLFKDAKDLGVKKVTGFSLTICQELMRGQNGDLSVNYDEKNNKTLFKLKLPGVTSFFED